MGRHLHLFLAAAALVTAPAGAHAQQYNAIVHPSWAMLLSGLKGNAAQASTVTNQSVTGVQQSAQAGAATVAQSLVTAAIGATPTNYAYETGQGWKPCMTNQPISDQTAATNYGATMLDAMAANEREQQQADVTTAQSVSDIVIQRYSMFCSVPEQAAGLCSRTTAYEAGNSDASPFLVNRSFGQEEMASGLAYTDAVAPTAGMDARSKENEFDVAVAKSLQALKNARASLARTALYQIISQGASVENPAMPGATPPQ